MGAHSSPTSDPTPRTTGTATTRCSSTTPCSSKRRPGWLDILGRTTVTVRNGHHQAVGDVAPQLRVAAHGVDGVIEAIEHRDPDTWVLGVQWHPEDTDGPAADREALFRAFLVSVDTDRRASSAPWQ